MSTRFKTVETEESVSCNLIPMVDIMFLLLLFFMLSADMSQREMEDVTLPEADQAQEEEKVKGINEAGRTTVSVYHRLLRDGFNCAQYASGRICREQSHWLLAIRGNDYTLDTIAPPLRQEAELEMEDKPGPAGKPLSKRHLMIRADANSPYAFIQKVMESAAAAGLYKIELAAMKPDPTKDKGTPPEQ